MIGAMESQVPPTSYGPPISLDLAKRVIAAAEAEAVAHHWPMTIAVVDSGGHLTISLRLDHAPLGSIAVAQSKAETAVNFRLPTSALREAVAAGGLGLLSVTNLSAVDGGLPLVVDGRVIGAIGASGMDPSQDSQVALAGARALPG
ncbi:MAG TPA: heme-binding protein [Candidatus Limnocylindria bacterium]|nr:heme-binding protein [Candidatus Limnocylindria bacterium]